MNLFILIYIIWFSSEIILNRFARSSKSDKKSTDRNTELLIWISVIVSVTAGVLIAIYKPLPIFDTELFSTSGLAIIFMGIILRFVAIKQLGKFFTVDVTIREDHQLLQTGLYKYLRHPSYTGSLISFLGFGISLNNWISLFVVFLLPSTTFIYRINIEEKVLIGQFDENYRNYISKTKRLVPFLY